MKAILQVHLTMLFVAAGSAEQLAEEDAQEMVHLFIAGVYALPMIGALIADRLLGKYNTILWLSIVYCAGHGVLAVGGENSINGMLFGLGLIALGSGGIKPCVSAHVGDQFGKSNWHLVDKVYQAFYFIINFGSFFATLLIPVLNKHYGPSIAFGLPGILMAVATLFFWMGRKDFVHVPANPGGRLGFLDVASSSFLFLGFIGLPMFFVTLLGGWVNTLILMGASIAVGFMIFAIRQKIEPDDGFIAVSIARLKGGLEKYDAEAVDGTRAVVRIFSIFILVSVFWALFDQHSSSWIRQGKMMDLQFMSLELLPSQIQALNPLMVMILIPINLFFIYPAINKMGFEMRPLRKMTIGMFIASLSFVSVALIQAEIDSSPANSVSIGWQLIPFILITQAEVLVSITGLEFAYTQAPKRMKSTIMGFWLLVVALGNKLVAIVTKLPDMSLERFFWTFAALMAGAAVLFGLRAYFYQEKT
ncbi:MAG: MFS transporter, partial [Verrucomicrobiales bacterium]|nr:MFS transporter [Verrucomicrobiales bacterium]